MKHDRSFIEPKRSLIWFAAYSGGSRASNPHKGDSHARQHHPLAHRLIG